VEAAWKAMAPTAIPTSTVRMARRMDGPVTILMATMRAGPSEIVLWIRAAPNPARMEQPLAPRRLAHRRSILAAATEFPRP
jgi:hypothetical protein